MPQAKNSTTSKARAECRPASGKAAVLARQQIGELVVAIQAHDARLKESSIIHERYAAIVAPLHLARTYGSLDPRRHSTSTTWRRTQK